MADVSVNDLVQRVRDLLSDTALVLTSTTTNTGTSITISDPTNLTEGDYLEWQTGTVGYERMLITNANGGVNPITVVRGVDGTTAETHTSGDALLVNPSFTGRQTQQALRAGLRKLWPYAYKVTAVDLGAYTEGKVWYDLAGYTALPMGMVAVRQRWGTAPNISSGDFVKAGSRGGLPVVWDFTLDTAIAASGYGVRFLSGLYDQSASAQHPFAHVASEITGASDIPDDGRFPVADALTYFAAGRMTGALEIPRVATGGDLEEASSVGTGARTSTGIAWMGEYQRLIQSVGIRYRNFYRPLDVQ